MVNVTPARQQMTETLIAARLAVETAQSLWEEAESAFEQIEAQSRHFRPTRRLTRSAAQARAGHTTAP